VLSSTALATTSVVIYPNLSPVRIPDTALVSPNRPAYIANVLEGLRLGLPNFGGDQTQDPAAFNTIGSPITNGEGHIEIGLYDMFGFPVNSWRGKVYPSGPFANEYGTFLRTSARIESTTPFTVSDVTYGIVDPLFQFDGNGADTIVPGNYEGVSWGADQLRGTTDDTLYTGDSLMTPGIELNELNIAGPGWIIYYLPDPAWGPQDFFKDARAIIENDYNGKYEARVYFGLRDTVSAVNFTASVPDSGPMVLVSAAALFGVVRLSRRQGA
jgi:hypothetical protein